MKFSERYGYKSVRESIQIESMDMELRNSLWNVINVLYFKNVESSSNLRYLEHYERDSITLRNFFFEFWVHFLKQPLDEASLNAGRVLKNIKDYFFKSSWYEVYDFLEFFVENYRVKEGESIDGFIEIVNNILEREMSAYRIVNKLVTRVTSDNEIDEIETAIEEGDEYAGIHLRRALELLSDRQSPDYRNSIKESISAVERIAAHITGESKGTLGSLLKEMDSHVSIHPALRNSFNSMYGWTSDEGGIRHALQSEEIIDFFDAKYMLVTCSAFINYIDGKLSKY